MRLLLFASVYVFASLSFSVSLAKDVKLSAKDFVQQAVSKTAHSSLQLIEHKGVSWFPRTQLRAERKGVEKNGDKSDSFGLRFYNSGILSYNKKKKMSNKVHKLINLSKMQLANSNVVAFYGYFVDAWLLKSTLSALLKKNNFLKAKQKNTSVVIEQIQIKEKIDDTLLNIQLNKESMNSWSEKMKILGLATDINAIDTYSLLSPKQALANLKIIGVINNDSVSEKIELEKDIAQLELDLEVDDRRKVLDRLDISYERKDDGEKVYSVGLSFNVPFLEGDSAQNNFKNIKANQRIVQLNKEALLAKVQSKNMNKNFLYRSQKLQKDLNDLITLKKRVNSFKKNNFKMYSTLFEHLLNKKMRYYSQYREFIGLYLLQLSYSENNLNMNKNYLRAL